MKHNRKLSLHALIIYRITLSEFVLAGYCRAGILHLKGEISPWICICVRQLLEQMNAYAVGIMLDSNTPATI